MFADYLNPLMQWIHDHPTWGLLITFLISFSESLAIIGSVIPGSVTMTAIGILVGAEVMRFDLTFIASTLGAIAGDSASFFLGFKFKERLPQIWPFSKYPNWLKSSKEFFAQHGGKSVLIGRFIGPLRAMIPVIAGMMHMNQWQFLVVNVISAIAWSLLYLLPGVLIGSAGYHLPPNISARLFIGVLIILGIIWLANIIIKLILPGASKKFRKLLLNKITNRQAQIILFYLSPRIKPHYEKTIIWLLILLICILIDITLIYFISHPELLKVINQPSFAALKAINTKVFNAFFKFCLNFTNIINLNIVYFLVTLICIFKLRWRILSSWLLLGVLSIILFNLFNYYLIDIINNKNIIPETSFIFLATAYLIFLEIITFNEKANNLEKISSICIWIIIALNSLGYIYFAISGVLTVITEFMLGFTLAVFVWIIHRMQNKPPIHLHGIILPPVVAIYILTSLLLFLFQYL